MHRQYFLKPNCLRYAYLLASTIVACLSPVMAIANDKQVNDADFVLTSEETDCDKSSCNCGSSNNSSKGCNCDCGSSIRKCCCCRPKWYGSAEALFLRRDNSNQAQAIVLNGATNETLISSGNLNFATEAGGRFTLGHSIGRCWAVEASYLGLQEWSDSITATGNNNLRIPGDIALATLDFLDADIMRVDYDSEIHSAEISAVRSLGRLDILAGFRYFQLDENFNINSEDFNNGTSDYSIAVRNSLFGGQLGARLESSGDVAYLRCTTKAGVYGVDSDQRTHLADFDNSFVFRDSSTSGNDVAFIGEVNLEAIVPLTSHCRLRAGYNVMWVEGISLAMDQLDFTDTPTSGTALDQSGGAFFYGANVGFEATW